MSNIEQDNTTNLEISDNSSSLSWVHKLTKEEITKELTARKLKITGTIVELKGRLFKYLKGEATPDIFETDSTKTIFPIFDSIKDNTMSDKKPYYKPGTFSGSTFENIDSFLKRFERASIINNWDDLEKTQYIAVYLEGAALTFYENISCSIDKICWGELEKKLRLEFEPIAQTDMLRLMLEKRKQFPDEHTISYINEAEALCRRIDSKMSQGEMVRNIMKGLKPSIARYIGIMGNESLEELKRNVRKYEMIEFMITGEINSSPFDIEKSIIHSNIQQINADKQSNSTENTLRNEINDMKKIIEQLSKTMNNNLENKYNTINNPPNQFVNKQNPNNYNKLPWLNQQNENYSYLKNTHAQHNTNSPTPHTTFYENQNSISRPNPSQYDSQNNRNSYINNNPNNNFNNHRPMTKFCNFCKKNNHTEEVCFIKNNNKNKKFTTCQFCDTSGHTAKNCQLLLENKKN